MKKKKFIIFFQILDVRKKSKITLYKKNVNRRRIKKDSANSSAHKFFGGVENFSSNPPFDSEVKTQPQPGNNFRLIYSSFLEHMSSFVWEFICLVTHVSS
jgi:hypothetical protein